MHTQISRNHKLTFRKKLAFAAVSLITFFAVLEGALALLGIAPTTATDDPFVGFSSRIPFLQTSTNESGERIVSTASNKLRWFNAQSFPLRKAPATRRIFCLGGSTTYGHPYWDSTSYSRWMREFLPIADASRHWEVVNLGGISYASYRVAAIMEELVQYEPDIFIIFSAHNEFLERRTFAAMFDKPSFYAQLEGVLARTRTWAAMDRLLQAIRARSGSASPPRAKDVLPADVDEVLNHSSGPVDYHRDPIWQANVLRHYETNLRRMIAIAHGCGAKIVFVAPASNEKNCAPFKSEPSGALDAQQRGKLDQLLREADGLNERGSIEEALAALRAARDIDPRQADLLYRLGHALFAIGRHDEARQAFTQALIEDVCPLRALPAITAAIRRVAADSHAPIVDFEGLLRAKCLVEHGHGILGEEYFYDHVHPTVETHRRLAVWIIDELRRQGMVGGLGLDDASMRAKISTATERVLAQIDEQAQGVAQRNLAKVLHWAGKYEEAAARAREAMRFLDNDPESRYVLADCLKNMGLLDEAIAEYDRLFQNDVAYSNAYNRFGEVLALRGHFTAAKTYLMLGILRDPENANAQRALGMVHLELGEFAFAVESLTEARRLNPNDPQTEQLLARAMAANSEPATPPTRSEP